MPKQRYFHDGGEVEPFVDPTEVASVHTTQPEGRRTNEGSFKSAFAAARRSGVKTFTWRGKSYTTELASDNKSTSRPNISTDVQRGGASVDLSKNTPSGPMTAARSRAILAEATSRENPRVGRRINLDPRAEERKRLMTEEGYACGGKVKKYASGGQVRGMGCVMKPTKKVVIR